MPVPMAESFARAEPVPEVAPEVIERRFTPEEAKQVGLVNEAAVDWSERCGATGADGVDLDLGDADAAAGAGVALDRSPSSTRRPSSSSGRRPRRRASRASRRAGRS